MALRTFLLLGLALLGWACARNDTVYVACAPEALPPLLRDTTHVRAWLSPRMEGVEWDSSGTRLSLRLPLPGYEIPVSLSLTPTRDAYRIRYASDSTATFPLSWEWHIRPEDNGSRVELVFDYPSEHPLLAWPVERTLREMRREMLARFRSLAEARCPRQP